MAFKLSSPAAISVATPEELFRNFGKKKIPGLLAQQSDMLRAYMKQETESDVALELPTGSGKTLVGLLIAEWRRVARKERCLYLCPTRQLVNQVCEQAKEQYGLEVINFSGSARDYSVQDKTAFQTNQKIGVSTYSALFNTNPFFIDVDCLIFDDAHVAENYVAKFWSLEIDIASDNELFNNIISLILPYIPENDRDLFEEDASSPDKMRVNKLPSPRLFSIEGKLSKLLECAATSSNERLFYGWQTLKGHLAACHLYYSPRTILIRPFIPPTESFVPFTRAKHRIYMSATLGNGGDLERIFGRKSIAHIPAPTGWERQGVGRRFFVFPMCSTNSEEESIDQAIAWIPFVPRCLVLTPSIAEANVFGERITEKLGETWKLFSPPEIESSKKTFISTQQAVAIVANRYDGIDMNGDECRYLIVHGHPEAVNLQDRFLMSRLGSYPLFDNRIRTRIIQALGRCTRSATDYALVVVIGNRMHNYLLKPENRRFFHPELQAELIFGIEQSTSGFDDIEENIKFFFQQEEEWQDANRSIIDTRDRLSVQSPSYLENLSRSVSYEVAYQNALWNGDYEQAAKETRRVLGFLDDNELKGYKTWWHYSSGNVLLKAGYPQEAGQSYGRAKSCTPTLSWLNELKSLAIESGSASQDDSQILLMMDNLEHLFEKFGHVNDKKINAFLKETRQFLISKDGKTFEQGQEKVGILVGWKSERKKAKGAPDCWWYLGNRGIVFEDNSEAQPSGTLGDNKVRQAASHVNTLKGKYPQIAFETILCTNVKTIESSAVPHAKEVFYLSVDDFLEFSEEVISCVQEIWSSFSQASDLFWREKAIAEITSRRLDPNSIFQRLCSKKLNTLPQSR